MKKPNPPEPDVEPIPTPKMTRYEQLARDVLDALKAMMEEIPKLEEKERKSNTFIRTYIGIPLGFLDTTVQAVELTPELERLQQLNVSGAYSSRHLGRAFRPVVFALARYSEDLQLLLDTRQANVAFEALNIYAIAKMLSRRRRNREGPGLVGLATVARMKRELGHRGIRKKKAGAAPAAPARKKRRLRPRRTVTQRLQRRRGPEGE